MTNSENKIIIPSWLINTAVSALIPLVINGAFLFYWAGKTSAQQDSTTTSLRQLREDVRDLREQINKLNERSVKKD